MSEPLTPRCFALVPCAGTGTRAATPGPKQYALLAGRPMVAYALAALLAVRRLDAVLVALAPGDDVFASRLPEFTGERAWTARCGGVTRAATVAAGLAVLRERGAGIDDWVLVHDAARCLLAPVWVDRLIDACWFDDVGGLLALPLADTLKQAAGEGADCRSIATVARHDKWVAQTPQMFRIGRLQDALARAGDRATDEASAIEATGLAPRLVPGDSRNLKLTWPSDFAIAEALLRARPEEPA